MTDDIFKRMAGIEEVLYREKQKRIAEQRITPARLMSEALTAQSLLARILKSLKEELETTLMPPEVRDRLCNILTSSHRNYKFARTNILTLFDYAIKKRLIK